MNDDQSVLSDNECKFTPPGDGSNWISGVAEKKTQNKTLYCDDEEASPLANNRRSAKS